MGKGVSVYRDNLMWLDGMRKWVPATKDELRVKMEWWRWPAGAKFYSKFILK